MRCWEGAIIWMSFKGGAGRISWMRAEKEEESGMTGGSGLTVRGVLLPSLRRRGYGGKFWGQVQSLGPVNFEIC